MFRRNITMAASSVLFVSLMSLPFLVPHTGALALIGIVPLLCMERIAALEGMKRFWLWHYTTFVLWNAVTTFWVCNATVGGGIFAALANAFQMSLVFGIFRWSKKTLKGSLPYILLAMLWTAWEKYYLTAAQISWPWLVLGNAFARTTSLAQWYEYTGTLGGSVWIWACNLGVFGLLVSLSDGSWNRFNTKAKAAAAGGCLLVFSAPMVLSMLMYSSYSETSSPIETVILQPDIDPYSKFQSMPQAQQNIILLDQLSSALSEREDSSSVLLAVAPETFTGDIVTGDYEASPTWRRFRSFLSACPGVNLLFGASSHSYVTAPEAPSATARNVGKDRWRESHNSALMMDGTGETQIYHKSKLVVAVEMTPYPKVFCKIDDLLGGVMGRCIGQKEVSLLNCIGRDSTGVTETIPVGCAVCYESVYPEHCAEYVRKGAEILTVITNDAWWGDTPGYRQHFSYARLRAIETRRDIIRSANTGISGIINQKGDVVTESGWWKPAVIRSHANLNSRKTYFVQYGDIAGRLCVFFSLFLLLATAVRAYIRK